MIAVSMDPADPALNALILSTAREEFENFVLSSHIMQAVGIFYGTSYILCIALRKYYSELTALSMNRLWATRVRIGELGGRHESATMTGYDYDYNILTDNWERKETILYKLDSTELQNLPSARMEQLIRHMSYDPHQALLVWHTAMQGTVMFYSTLH